MEDKVFIGIDVAQDWVDIADTARPGRSIRIDNRPEPLAAWVQTLDPTRTGLVAFEPTGGLERPLRRALVAAGVAFAQVHPNEVVAYRTCRGIKAKTDALDAGLLADFAKEELSRRGLGPLVEADDELRDMLARRRQLVEARHAEKCRLSRVASPWVRDSIETMLALLTRQLDAIDAAIAAHVKASEPLAALSANLRSFTGCGPIVASTLMGDLPELGRLSGKEIAALVGARAA